jgi:hypothetical protein
MEYVKRYKTNLVFNSTLVKVDGERKIAYFDIKDSEGNESVSEKDLTSYMSLHRKSRPASCDTVHWPMLPDGAKSTRRRFSTPGIPISFLWEMLVPHPTLKPPPR